MRTPKRRRSILRALVPWFPAALACLSSWLYATAKFANHLTIRHYSRSVLFWPDSWDHWLTRFYPIPLDPRVRPGVSLHEIAEPYLDAQVNVPLLIFFLALCVAVIWVRREDPKIGNSLRCCFHSRGVVRVLHVDFPQSGQLPLLAVHI